MVDDHDPELGVKGMEGVPPEYWLGVCRGLEAAVALVEASSETICEVLNSYRILALPEFPAAIEALGQRQGRRLAKACRATAKSLRKRQAKMRDNDAQDYSMCIYSFAFELIHEYRQNKIINLLR